MHCQCFKMLTTNFGAVMSKATTICTARNLVVHEQRMPEDLSWLDVRLVLMLVTVLSKYFFSHFTITCSLLH